MTTVTLRQLTDDEYAGYRARAVPEYADELVRSRGLSPEVAAERSATTFPATVADVVAEEGASISRVLTADEQPVGWLWLAPASKGSDSLFVYDIEIDEPHRGRGLGRATMLAAEDVARAAGHRFVRLNVFGWNTSAQALYRSLGYRTDAIQMSKPLEEPT
jgi:ribosomal protein S18 acetylase RimI-like enzyme